MRYERVAEIDPRIDTDTGEFEMVMATEGEASDGHIISIKGLETGRELPLQLDHNRSAVANLGIVTNMRRDAISGLPVMRGVGQIRLTGDGEALAARRDLVDAISTGHVRGVSLTWDSVKHRERRDLPRSHPAHVGREEPDQRKRFGLFFDQSRAIEQSVVGIPADREALIGRSEAAEDAISRAMWHSLVERLSEAPRSREAEIIDDLERSVRELEARLLAAEEESSSDPTPPPPLLEVSLETARDRIASALKRSGDTWDDRLATMGERFVGR